MRSEMEAGFAAVRSEMQSGFAAVSAEMVTLELKLEARFERGFRQVIVTMATLMVAGFIATVVASLTR